MGQLFETEKKAMSEDDRERMNGEHVKRQLELEALKDEKRSVTSVYRIKIHDLEEKIHKLATDLDAGVLDVRFEVVEEPDDGRLLMVIAREDNGQVIKTRPMTEVEKEAARKRKQKDLFEPPGELVDMAPAPRGKSKSKANGKGRARGARA